MIVLYIDFCPKGGWVRGGFVVDLTWVSRGERRGFGVGLMRMLRRFGVGLLWWVWYGFEVGF